MKLLRVGPPGAEIPALFAPDGTRRSLAALLPDIAGPHLAPESLARLAGIDWRALPTLPDTARLGPPVARPVNFVCVGLNYRAHAAETRGRIPSEPILFLKSLSAFSGPQDDVVIPRGSRNTDWEVELGVVIGTLARSVPEHAAMAHVAGYCVVNDISERKYQTERGGQWDKGKGCDTFGPVGPLLVTRDEVADPQSLDLWLDVDGEKRQRGTTRDMIFDVRKLVSYTSHFFTLHPGDIIATGTPPGVGMGMTPPTYLRAGQVMTLGVTGLGEQRLRVVEA